MTTANDVFDMTAAPMRIEAVRLKVRDLDAVAAFYRAVLGLSSITSDERRVTLGTDRTPLLELVGDPDLSARPAPGRTVPHRLPDAHARRSRAMGRPCCRDARAAPGCVRPHRQRGVYLADPEGNGIEVYADRPVSRWHGESGEIRMSTDPLDVQDLLQSAEGTEWSDFPEEGSVGHVHLQVGDTEAADHFYRDVLGLDIAARYPSASFYGSGGYHHQLAGNVWNSRRAGKRPERMAGLDAVEVGVRDAADLAAIAVRAEGAGFDTIRNVEGLTLHDPWGTAITLRH